jgi:hypothetical protein
MKISEVMIGVSITKQPAQYESVKTEARITACSPVDGEITEEDRKQLQADLSDLLMEAYQNALADFWRKSR